MAVNLYDGTNHNGLFNILGKLFKTQADINTSRGTTIPADVLAAITYFNNITPNSNLEAAMASIQTAITQYQSGASGSVTVLQTCAENFLIAMVGNDKTQPDNSLKTAIQYIITQMLGSADSLNVSAVTAPVTVGGSNVGNGVLITSTKRGDGLVQENTLPETIAGIFSASGLTAGLSLKGQQTASSPLGQDWPLGSACNATITSIDANQGSIITNGGFEAFNIAAGGQPNVPDGWLVAVGTPGTTLLATVNQVLTVVISGTPTGGTYNLTYTNATSKVQATVQLPFNATGSAVQTALRALAGLSLITVVQTGSTPNFTNTITMLGVGGDPTVLGSQSYLTGGSPVITNTITTHGTTQVFAGGQALQFVSNGSELTEIRYLIPQSQLTPLTAYAVSLWATCAASIAAGVVKVELFDGSAVIADAQSVSNVITFNASALTTSFKHLSALQASECVFRTPATLPPLVYLRIRISTALTNTKTMIVDQVALTALTNLYAGGPFAALFTGNTPWSAADVFLVSPTNSRAGIVREQCERNFSTSSLGLLFPTSGSPTIPDSVSS